MELLPAEGQRSMTRITKVERDIEKVQNERSPVKWRVRYRDPAGKRQVKTLDSLRQARDFLTKVNAAKLAGTYVDRRAGKILVSAYAKSWLDGRDVRPSTAARDESYVGSYILPRFGQLPIGQIRAADVAAWKMTLLGSKSPATVSKAITLFKSMLNDAVRDDLLLGNPNAGGQVAIHRARGDALPDTWRASKLVI
jgi:hypothetical protein